MAKTKVEPFGVGPLRPFRRTPNDDFASGGGQELLTGNVGQILGISPGEIRWRPSMCTNLTNLRQRLRSAAAADLARVSVESSLRRWEPMAKVSDVILEPVTPTTQNEIDLTVIWEAGENKVSGVRVQG